MSGNGSGNVRRLTPAPPPAGDDVWDVPQVAPADPVAESERAVLGAMILSGDVNAGRMADPDAVADALAILQPEHFAASSHQLVFESVIRVSGSGDPVCPVSVMHDMQRAGTLTRIGAAGLGDGGAFLHSLVQRAGQVSYHAPKVLEAWRRRNVALVLRQCLQITEIDDWDPDTHLDDIRKRVGDATAFTGPSSLRPNSEAVTEVLGSLEREEDPGLPTGFPDLDDAIGGLRPSEVIIIAGRPGSGKTLTGLCIADHVGTRLKLPVLFESLEMPEAQLTLRRIAAEARVPLVNLIRHQVTDDDWDRIARVSGQLMDTGLRIDAPSRAPVARFRRNLRAMARAGHAARLLVVDYLGYIKEPKAESRQQAVAENVRQVHDLAGEFAIPVILLAQLNRGPELRAEKRPVVADLRETGEAEQTADIAILIHREDAYEPESPRAGEVDLLIGKNRQGPLCTVTLAFQGHYGRMVSLGELPWSPSSKAE